MLPYWVLFSVPAFAAVLEAISHRANSVRPDRRSPSISLVWLIASSALITLFVGLRFQVGGDWFSYLRYYAVAEYKTFVAALAVSDPGYMALNWISSRLGGDIWLVNLLCGAIFTLGLVVFAKDQPRTNLAITIAIPYLVVVVATGYSRQGVAIGLAMLGLVALGRRSTVAFVLWTLLAATFHKSAVLLIPLAALAQGRGRWWNALWVGATALLAYLTLLDGSVDRLRYSYLTRGYQSEGATIRALMNAIPAAVFVAFRHRFDLSVPQRRLWFVLAAIAVASVPMLIVSPSTTAVDRLGLYLIPLQIFVFSRVPDTFARSAEGASLLSIGMIAYSAAVLFVWLNFASNAEAWLPYQFYPI